MLRRPWAPPLLLMLALLAGCTRPARRPVVFAEPTFEGQVIVANRTGVLLPSTIDVRAVVQDMVAAYPGNPARGAEVLRTQLAAYLTGRQPIYGSNGSHTVVPVMLELRDLTEFLGAPGVPVRIDFAVDSLGISSMHVSDPDTMAAILAHYGCDNLIAITSARLTRGSRETSSPISNYRSLESYIQLECQAFVWRIHSKATVWHGFINGTVATAQFEERDAAPLARAVAEDLRDALDIETDPTR